MTAIGRPLSRMPVIIRSHESSAVKYDGRWEMGDGIGGTNFWNGDKLLNSNKTILHEKMFNPHVGSVEPNFGDINSP